MSTQPLDPYDDYRRAALRLRVLLFGDESSSPGALRGSDETRLRVRAELRHMQRAVDELEASRKQAAAPPEPADDLLRPADAARALGVDVSWVYRAVRNGDVRAVKLSTRRRGAIRIPVGEVRRIAGGSPSRRS